MFIDQTQGAGLPSRRMALRAGERLSDALDSRPAGLGRSVMSASIHDKLNRVRKPRVHITYEVETEGAEVVRELPFVVGVLGDFSGDPTTPLRPMAERKFIQIDRDNFNDVM